MKLTNIISAC